MALLDSRGMLKRCPNCDTAVAEDARLCTVCGERVDGGEAPPPPRKGAARPVLGTAGGGLFSLLGLGRGTSALSNAIESFGEQLFNAFGHTAVKLLGMKTGPDALDDNPWADTGPADAATLLRRRLYRLTFGWRTNLSETTLITFYRDLAKYADAGIGFHDALARLQKSTKSPVLARVLKEVRADLFEGATLAEAFGKHAYLFEPLHLALLEVGESLGTVGDNMRLLVETIEERREIRRALARKFVQPVMLLILANYVLTFPVFLVEGVLGYLETIALPTMAFAFVGFNLLVLLPVVSTALGRKITDRVRIELPGVGSVARANALARFARALSAALGAGVEMGKSIRISAKAADNVIVADAVLASLPFIQEHGLAEGLRLGGVLPDDVADDLAHGEVTGTVAPTLAQISKDARARAARGTAILAAILSFVLILFSVVFCIYSIFSKVIFQSARFRPVSLPSPSVPGFRFPGTR